MRHGNKVNEIKVLTYCKALWFETIKNNKKLFPLCQTYELNKFDDIFSLNKNLKINKLC